MSLQEFEQPVDSQPRDHRCRDDANHQRQNTPCTGLSECIFELHQPRNGDGRDAQKERKPSGIGPFPTVKERSSEGAAGAGDTRNESQNLGQSHKESIAALNLIELLGARSETLSKSKQEGHQDGHPSNGGNTAQRRGFVTRPIQLDRQSGKQDGQGANRHGDSQSRFRLAPLPPAHSTTDPAQNSSQICPEVGNHRHDAAQLNHCSHRNAGITPTGEHRHNFEVGCAADGQKLRESLHNAENEISPDGFKKTRLRHRRFQWLGGWTLCPTG